MAIKSMSLALANAIVAYLNAQQMMNPGNFPSGLTWTAQRQYMPVLNESTFPNTNPANAPRVLVFPRDDSEEITGIGGSSASEGDYEAAIMIDAFVGPPVSGFEANVDPLMHLRQAIRTILKPAGVVEPVGIVTGNVKLTKIEGNGGYDLQMLLRKQIFSSVQFLKFSVCPV